MSIVSGPACSGNFTWWQVGYNGAVGWSAESSPIGYDYVPNGYPLPYIPGHTPNPTPVPQATSTWGAIVAPTSTTQSGGGPGICSSDDGSLSYDSNLQKFVSFSATSPQCVSYVESYYPGLKKNCPDMHGDAYTWLVNALKDQTLQGCAISVNSANGGLQNFNWLDIHPGDIVVWQPGCGAQGQRAGSVGHVGILEQITITPPNWPNAAGPVYGVMVVGEINWNNSPVLAHNQHIVDATCMAFIHVPSSYKNN